MKIMRKLYALLAGFVLLFISLQTKAQNETADFNSAISGNNVHFTNNSSTNANDTALRRVYWQFGDGTGSLTLFNADPHHTYLQSGTYQVCLKLFKRIVPTTINGDTLMLVSSICKPVVITVPDSCTAKFEPLFTSSTPLGKYFVAQPWHNHNKKPIAICWTFGDGKDTCIKYDPGTSSNYAVYHLYAQPGVYNVCVKIIYDGGCESKSCHEIKVGEVVTCAADFQRVPVSSSANPLYASFQALTSNSQNNKPVLICWSFGDGKDTCIQYTNTFAGPYTVNHKYENPGAYEVCIKILYAGGCEARKCRVVEIRKPDECKIDFERVPVLSTTNPLTVIYKALPSNSSNRKPARICWTFGDGTDMCVSYLETYTGSYNVTHTYANAHLYEVCVKVFYYGGCEAKNCKPVEVGRPDSCRADFERIQSTPNNASLASYFRALPWNNNNKKPATICWTFGDGRDTCIKYGADYTGQYVVGHNYLHPGTYEVCIKIFYYGGCEAKKCKTIQIGEPDSCRADFETISVASNSLRKYFTAITGHNHNKKPVYICWKFGDGKDTCIQYSTSFTGPYAVGHNYATPGQYEVCVRIVYDGGCESKKCKMVQVGEPVSCSADFERSPLQDNDRLTVGLKAITWNSHNKKPARICWYFGDGRDTCISYGEDYNGIYAVGHHYKEPGKYEVCIKILYYGGCEAKKCKVIEIPPVQASCSVKLFEIIPSITSLVRGFVAIPSSNPDRRPERICWYFGDGKDTCIMIDELGTLPDFIIRHTYPGPGVYKACVKVLFRGGCIAYDCREVAIRGTNNVCGGYMVESLTGPRTFQFKGFSIHNPNDEAVGFRWTFGDGSASNEKEVTHTYAQGGDYEVCLYIKTRLGCETRICKKVRVPGNNEPALHLSPMPVINIMHVQFFSTHTEQVGIKILNANGVVVRSYIRNVTVGNNNWDIDLSTLMPGIYSFVLQSPNQLSSALFIKQ
jgi:PKD repeat protein